MVKLSHWNEGLKPYRRDCSQSSRSAVSQKKPRSANLSGVVKRNQDPLKSPLEDQSAPMTAGPAEMRATVALKHLASELRRVFLWFQHSPIEQLPCQRTSNGRTLIIAEYRDIRSPVYRDIHPAPGATVHHSPGGSRPSQSSVCTSALSARTVRNVCRPGFGGLYQ